VKLSRRSWFAAITAPFAVRFLPKPAPLPDALFMNTRLVAAKLADNFFVDSPLCLYLKRNQGGAYSTCDGGLSIGQPLFYSRDPEPAWTDNSDSLTIHNPLNLPVREDGANQCR